MNPVSMCQNNVLRLPSSYNRRLSIISCAKQQNFAGGFSGLSVSGQKQPSPLSADAGLCMKNVRPQFLQPDRQAGQAFAPYSL